jgi:hypothetical protein
MKLNTMRDSVKSARLLTLIGHREFVSKFQRMRNFVKKIRCDESGR